MTASTQPVLSVTGLTISFPAQEFTAVKEVSFSLSKGSTLAIVGESGSGKSLMALSLMGLQPKAANIQGTLDFYFDGQTTAAASLTQKAWEPYRGSKLGMIFQEPMSALNPTQTVGSQVRECILQHSKLSSAAARQKAEAWIGKVKLPDPKRIYKRYPHQLSGGQKQRIMIAMAMCNHPEVLIADEPTTALDATVQQEIIQLMQELQSATETAMIFITHDLALAAEIADEILVMQSGIPVEYGTAAQVLQEPQHPYTQALLSCRPQITNKGKKLPVIADFLAGNTVHTALPQAANTAGADTLLSVRGLQVWYPEEKNLFGKTTHFFKAVNGISFDIREGTTLGLVGESGCGKSTTGKALMGLAPVRAGSILFQNRDIARLKGKDWNPVRREIQLIFQDPYASLNPRHTVGNIITEPLHIYHSRGNKARETERLLDLVQLPKTAANRYPHQFSGGQRQRIGIARALALHPRLLICDESVSALDVSVQAQVLNLLKELQYEMKLSYLFIAHDLSVVHYMSDEIIVMQAGMAVEQGSPDDILLHPQEPYTQKLVAAVPGSGANL